MKLNKNIVFGLLLFAFANIIATEKAKEKKQRISVANGSGVQVSLTLLWKTHKNINFIQDTKSDSQVTQQIKINETLTITAPAEGYDLDHISAAAKAGSSSEDASYAASGTLKAAGSVWFIINIVNGTFVLAGGKDYSAATTLASTQIASTNVSNNVSNKVR